MAEVPGYGTGVAELRRGMAGGLLNDRHITQRSLIELSCRVVTMDEKRQLPQFGSIGKGSLVMPPDNLPHGG